MAEPQLIRLHITPFNPDLLERFIPPSLKSQASSISFHTVETFPERGFGYVELPAMEAQKLKKKFNGNVLKGAKIVIEEARPEKKSKKRKSEEAAEDIDDVKETKKKKKAKREKSKREDGVIPGHELEDGRHVKRGWDDDSKGKKKNSEKNSLEGKKMRFKTEVPPNKVSFEGKEKKNKPKDRQEKAKGSKKAVVVKEFSKRTKPTSSSAPGEGNGKKDLTYEDGNGWVDEDGHLVEEEPSIVKRKRTKAVAPPEPAPVIEPESDSSSDISKESSVSSSDETSSVESSVSESSSDESGASEHEGNLDRQLDEAKNNTASNAAHERNQRNSIAVPFSELNEAAKEVHPLEALFKRPSSRQEDISKLKLPPVDTSFSFFSRDIEDEEMKNDVPQTPHTKQDLEWRSVRSAAPTPDTAAIGKRFNFDFNVQEDEDEPQLADTDMAARETTPTVGGKGERDESEFRKWFYENRGDLNRAWKKRRREERKVVRQRDNRRLSRRMA